MKCLSIVPIKTNRIETKNRKIITDIPAPDTIDTIKKCLNFYSKKLGRETPRKFLANLFLKN